MIGKLTPPDQVRESSTQYCKQHNYPLWLLKFYKVVGPENNGATQQVKPTGEEHDQGDQALEPPAPQEEPRSREPKVPTGGRDPQVEVDEVKGSEV